MIWESQYWKEDLTRLALRLGQRSHQSKWSERSLGKLEKEIFIGFYSIRKLLEAKKLSEDIVNGLIPADSFKWSGGRKITHLTSSSALLEAFDFNALQKVKLSLRFVCNQVIHSYIYKETFDENGRLCGILISSDCQRNKTVFFITLKNIIKAFSEIGKDYPSNAEFRFDSKSGDYIVKNW
ncbi:MAG: hypothetical protein KIT40_02405 [Nitrospira sp.]|nr:hypothetical protein [Nitrospira sp.]